MSEAPRSADLELGRITRHKLAETVARQLMDQIRDKQLPPGTRLPSERQLQAALGVGRSTVREAINGLHMMGVIQIRQGSGAFVAEPAPAAPGADALAAALARGVTHELFEARRVVEVETARLAAARRTPSEVDEMAAILAEHRRLVDAGELAVEPSVAFHRKVAEAAHNDLLEAFVASFSDQLAARGPVLEDVEGFQEWEIGQHTSVFEPIRDGNERLAARRMRAHLDAVIGYHERIGLPE